MRYEPASPAPTARACQTGTLALADAVRDVYPELACMTPVYGCFNRRHVAGSTTWSLHAEGRALDIGAQSTQTSLAWQLACELVAHRLVYGTMRVIWNRHIWSTERPDEWRPLGPSTAPHDDHVHVEQFRRAAARPRSSSVPMTAALRLSRAAGGEVA